MSLISPRMVQRMSSTAVTAAAVGQRHQRAVTTPRSDPPEGGEHTARHHRGQFGVAELSPVLRVHRRVDHPDDEDVDGTQQGERRPAPDRPGTARGCAAAPTSAPRRSTSPERPELLVIRFIAINPPRPSRKAGMHRPVEVRLGAVRGARVVRVGVAR